MAYTDIDRVNGRTIRKLHSPDKSKTFGFLSGVKNPETKDMIDVVKHANLTEAREYCGFKHDEKHLAALVSANMPKSTHPQNVAGYDPHNAAKR